IEMPVAPTPFGHVGVFPEQHGNWQWLQDVKPRAEPSIKPSARNALNLFAYTGASTLALAKAGFEVVHVDAAKPNVQLARLAAEINGLKDHPIRYLVDDATKFATRELRRGNRYHTIVLDPPAYGHGPGGKAWRLERDVWPLLDYCIQLIENKFDYRLLITGHSPQVTADDVIDCLCEQLPRRHGCSRQQVIASTESGRMSLMDAQQRRLDAGFFVRTRFNSESASAESDTTY
ncbi:MAG: class I SAM-dependent methyltransferase, partial [Planctomycetota bacterium]